MFDINSLRGGRNSILLVSLYIFIILKLRWTVICHWKRQPYFFPANLFLIQGISSEYVMVDFICMGLLDMWAAQTDNYIMKNSCTHWDSNTGPSAYEYSLSVVLLVDICIEYLNIDHIWPECALKLYLCRVPRGRCSKIFCRVLYLINSLQSANVLIKQTPKRYKYYMTKIQEKSFCYMYHVVQVQCNLNTKRRGNAVNI